MCWCQTVIPPAIPPQFPTLTFPSLHATWTFSGWQKLSCQGLVMAPSSCVWRIYTRKWLVGIWSTQLLLANRARLLIDMQNTWYNSRLSIIRNGFQGIIAIQPIRANSEPAKPMKTLISFLKDNEARVWTRRWTLFFYDWRAAHCELGGQLLRRKSSFFNLSQIGELKRILKLFSDRMGLT